jgi:hypothetical protein
MVEIGPGGPPYMLLSPQARRVAAALVEAANLVDRRGRYLVRDTDDSVFPWSSTWRSGSYAPRTRAEL